MTAKPLTPDDLKRFEQLLHERHADLARDAEREEAVLEETATRESQADEYVNARREDLERKLLEQDEERLRELSDALRRVEEKSYGQCEACGEWIARERLEEVPETRRCVTCQRMAEVADSPEKGGEEIPRDGFRGA